jgi:hypothetical protein
MIPRRWPQITKIASFESHLRRDLMELRRHVRRSIFDFVMVVFFGVAALLPAASSGQVPKPQTQRPSGTSAAAVSGSEAAITFRKVFKSSYPEFVEIKLTQSGTGTYDIRQLDDDPSPQPFDISASLAQKFFDLASKLHDFQGVDLEVHKRLANLGDKTFRYEKGAESHETTFNYTLDMTATELENLFEALSRQETDLSDLQRTMRYDRLGVNDVVLRIQADYDNKQLPEPERFLNLLDQLAADQKFIDIARDRARTLAGRIRSSR